jgi:hypothetical protein
VRPLELARILVISVQELETLTKAGVLKREIEKRGRQTFVVYNKDTNVELYIRHLRTPEIRAREEFLKEKRDTARIIREHKELDLAFARGDVIMRGAAVITLTNAVSIVKNQVLTLPTRLTRLLVGQMDPSKIRTLLKTHCSLCLRSIENFSFDSVEKESRNGHNAVEDEGTRKRKMRIASRR